MSLLDWEIISRTIDVDEDGNYEDTICVQHILCPPYYAEYYDNVLRCYMCGEAVPKVMEEAGILAGLARSDAWHLNDNTTERRGPEIAKKWEMRRKVMEND